MSSVCIYGLGGGLGHATRVLALGRALLQRRPTLRLDYILPQRIGHLPLFQSAQIHSPPKECEESATQLARWLEQLWQTLQPALLIVDVFPRGILAEFLECRRFPPVAVLLTRLCRRGYYESPQMQASLERYHQVYWTEGCSPGPLLRGTQEVGPVTLFHRPSLLPSSQARVELGFTGPEAGVLVLRAGPIEEQQQLISALSLVSQKGLRVVWADHQMPIRHPIYPYYGGADLVVSAAGYHAVYELAQMHIPVIFWPQRRLYDDQHLRLELLGIAREPKRWVAQTAQEFHKAFQDFLDVRDHVGYRRQGREQEYQGAQRLAGALLRLIS